MSNLNEVNFTRIRRHRRPSLWRRFLWWVGVHLTICEIVLIVASIYMALAVANAARSGAFGPGW